MSNFRSPDSSRALKKGKVYQDTRTFSEQLASYLPQWDYTIGAIILLSILPAIYPISLWLVIPTIMILARISAKNKINRSLPIKLPIELKKQTDFNAPKPGQKNKFYNAQGTIMLGNLRTDNTELWLTGKDMLTHMLLIGTTGAGKTETLVSLSSCTAFCMGGGTIYVDAKAAPKLVYQFATLARIFGREDDLRVISFITGDSGSKIRHWERLSNTTNPFAQGSANNAVQTLSSLLPAGGGDNQYFLDRAIALLSALMPALVELRDLGVLNIYPSLIGDFISLTKFMELSRNEIIIGEVEYKDVELTPPTLMIIRAFLKALPGFDPNKPPEKQGEQVHNQFGFAEGYFARTLSSLSGTYGHIYQTELAEADFIDIVMHNRILIVLVPAMGLAPEERTVLGKIILSCIRAAMGQGLGSKGEGKREDVLDALPVDLKIPTIIIVDEYAEVAVEGFAVTATQGRGLGMSVVFAGQDMAGFVRASEQEADMIFGNTRLKVLMALEDSEITWRKFKDLAGTMHVSESGGFEADKSGLASYKKNMSASVKEIDRINFLDLKEQTEGQAHVFERGEIHKAQLFHHGISDDDLVVDTRINRMLKVLSPKPDIVEGLQSHIERNFNIAKLLEGEIPMPQKGDEFKNLIAKHAPSKKKIDWPLLILEGIKKETQPTTPEVESPKTDSPESPGDKPELKQDNAPAKPVSINTETTTLSEEDDMLSMIEDEEEKPSLTHGKIEETRTIADQSSTPIERKNEEDIESNQLDNSTIKEASASKVAGVDKYVSDTLENVENHWVFKTIIDDNGISKSNNLYNKFYEMNTLVGQSDSSAKKKAVDSVMTFADSINYPSVEILPKEDDIKSLWEKLNKKEE